MIFNTIREKVIKDFITQELLSQSIYPSLERVCAIAIEEYNNSGTLSSLITDQFYVNENEQVSKAKHNELLKLTDIDLETLYKYLDYLERYLIDSHNSALTNIHALNRVATNLYSKANAILLKNEDADYGADAISDDFHNMDKVNQSITNAQIDTGNKYVTGSVKPNSTLYNFEPKNVIISPLSSGYTGFNIQSDYGAELLLPVFTPVAEISLKIELNEYTDINRLFMDFSVSKTYNISLTMMIDEVFVNISDFKEYKNFADIMFDTVKTRYIIINIKANNGTIVNNKRKFIFQIDSILAGLTEFNPMSIMQSTEYTVEKYSSIGLYTEEEVDDDISIAYQVSWETGVWHDITATNNTKIDINKNISVFNYSDYASYEYVIDITKSHPYISGTNYGLSSVGAVHTISDISEVYLNKPSVIRDVGNFSYDTNATTIVTCNIYVSVDTVFDFLHYPGYLSGIFKTTAETISPGLYSFSFNYANNIESYQTYMDALTNLIYGATIATYITPTLFASLNDNDYTFYTLIETSAGVYTPVLKHMVPKDALDESYYLIEKELQGGDLYPTNITLKAIINSKSYISPRLFSYKIKLRK